MSAVDAPGPTSDAAPVIRTPDQRLRVFVSSTLGELAPERRAVRAAIERLRLAPVMFEAGARPHPPRALYRSYLEQSHVFVGIYWQSYGWVAPGMEISGIEDEYRLVGSQPRLIYVKDPAESREPRLREFLGRIRDDDRVSYAHFGSPEELGESLEGDLALLLTERFEDAAASRGVRAPTSTGRPLPVPPTPLIGRERELKQLLALWGRSDVRLVTLTGVGGVGKTRLAVEAASRLIERFTDGVFFADLAPIQEAGAVPEAVARAAGIRGEGQRPMRETVIDGLAEARALLLLDNFEQVEPAAAFVGEILASCPGVGALVTSRAPLNLRGEHAVAVEPLTTPGPDAPAEVADLLAAPATRLFVERASEAAPGFQLTDENADAVAEVCRRLDGLPLAIELASTRVRLLPPRALLEQLGGRFDLAAGPVDLPERQRTLRATLDWSHELLDPAARALFARLSVFASGFTIAAAEAVAGSEETPDVLEPLGALVEQSLVTASDAPGFEPRFRMLETIREYAAEQLASRGEVESTLSRLADHLIGFVATAGEGLTATKHREWMRRLDAEAGNLEVVDRWAMEHGDMVTALRLWAPIWPYWWSRDLGDYAETRRALEAALPAASQLDPEIRVMYLWALGNVRFGTGDFDAAATALRELADLARSLEDRQMAAYADAMVAFACPYPLEPWARDLMARAAQTFRDAGDRFGTAYVVCHMGVMAALDGDLATSERLLTEAIDRARQVESDQMTAQVLDYFSLLDVARGRLDDAHDRLTESTRMYVATRTWVEGVDYALMFLAALGRARGDPESAARAIGSSRAIRERAGTVLWPWLQAWSDRLEAELEEALGPVGFDAALRAGAGTRPEAAVEAALAATTGGSA